MATEHNPGFPTQRPRRLRHNPLVRQMVRETALAPDDFILPLFVRPGRGVRKEIASMPGNFQLSVDTLVDEVGAAADLGIRAFILFGIPARKDATGAVACEDEGIVQQALRALRSAYKDGVVLITDECFCEYTEHGHCGVLSEYGRRRVQELGDRSYRSLIPRRIARVDDSDGAGHRRADYSGVELRFRIIELPLGLRQRASRARNLLLPRADLHHLKSFVERIDPLLIGIELCSGIVESLAGNDAGGGKLLRAIQNQLVIDQSGTGLIQVVLCLLNFLRPRPVFEFIQIRARIIQGALCLVVSRAKLLILKPHQNLTLFNLISFFNTDPGEPPRDF